MLYFPSHDFRLITNVQLDYIGFTRGQNIVISLLNVVNI